MPSESSDGRRVVDQRALHLLNGRAGLHECGLTGARQFVGLLDDEITLPALEPYVERRSTVQVGRTGPTHGDWMADGIMRSAPGCRLVTACPFDHHGLVFRGAIEAGMDSIRADDRVRLVNVSLEIRRTARFCTEAAPCRACMSLRRAVDDGWIVVVSAGNQAETSKSITCPAAESRGLVVAATTGPQGSSRLPADGPVHTETGTSITAAMITGAIASLMQAFPTLAMDELRDALAATSTRLPLAPPGSAGAGRPQFFRIMRYLQHGGRNGGYDVRAAETFANDAVRGLSAHSAEHPIPDHTDDESAVARELLERSVRLAPWSGELHLWLGLVLERHDRDAALEAARESARLDWSQPGVHDLFSRLLRLGGDELGADTELAVADRLRERDELAAADALFDGMEARSSVARTPDATQGPTT
ncbi:S8 family serine peptidase [Ilumatobacter sp.]|uniref:S8 family serine peptidase n=1 Tax=Ilumatobacter sp. TaxID=1967498 RepID=UPI003C484AAC